MSSHDRRIWRMVAVRTALGRADRQERGDRRPHALAALGPQEAEVVSHPLGRGATLAAGTDQRLRLVDQGTRRTRESGRSISARRAGTASTRGSEYAHRTNESSCSGVPLGVAVMEALEVLRWRSASVRVRAIWAIWRISGVQRRSDSTNWRRVSDPAGWWRNRCSWACSTGTYTTGRAPPIDDAGLVPEPPLTLACAA